MIKIDVTLNDAPSVLGLPANLIPDPPRFSGDKTNYRIKYGNGLEEVGGLAEVTFADNTEATVDITLPFFTLLDCQCTAVDIVGAHQESAHIEFVEDDKKLRLYSRVHQPYTGTSKLKWMAKGVI